MTFLTRLKPLTKTERQCTIQLSRKDPALKFELIKGSTNFRQPKIGYLPKSNIMLKQLL